MIRVALLDDHSMVREALSEALRRQGLEVVADLSASRDLWPVLAHEQVDVVLLDLGLKGERGLDVAARMRELHPQVGIAILTMDEEPRSVRAALQLGARAYLVKSATCRELFQAISAVYAGNLYLHGCFVTALLEEPVPGREQRAKQVLKLVAEGRSNQEIADQLHISRATVKTHLQELFEQYGVNDRTRLVVEALKAGSLRD